MENVSKYRSGPPRFGKKPYKDSWDPSVKTTKLTSDELEQLRNGKPVDEILKEREQVDKSKAKIAHFEKNVSNETTNIKKALTSENEPKTIEIDTSNTKYETRYLNIDYKQRFEELSASHEKLVYEAKEAEEKVAALEPEVNNLKREVIDAHKQLAGWQERFDLMEENFNAALIDKEHAINETVFLENQLSNARKEILRLNEEVSALKTEVKPLREFAFLKLSRDVNSA
ncbi:hypothetical protein OEV98_11115 [Caldibacillus lycopersici]|uniref:Uncharacterized protein n=1 Tax=Perspicuibacillus lycopersici TaxID=1325689 RepID=A0AAE3LMZ8_9BACI|nr:hypothetical protein [Perspicuibacillus lycopersici]MCU9614110.1 hypothetical protein [Perspicuibacillus lycopersici]